VQKEFILLLAAAVLILVVLWRPVGRKLIVPWIAWQMMPAKPGRTSAWTLEQRAPPE
jgi:hypothetical protein